jgi:hypothetical protein
MREHRELSDLVQDSESLKDPGGIGRNLNSGSDLIKVFVSPKQGNEGIWRLYLAQCRRLLADGHAVAGLTGCNCGGEASETGADDEDIKRLLLGGRHGGVEAGEVSAHWRTKQAANEEETGA